MTPLERLADWISGGALTHERTMRFMDQQVIEVLRKANENCNADFHRMADSTIAYSDALRAIAAMETPGAAPAAKRMARIAREALE